MQYTWLNLAQARQQLSTRLADPTNQYWLADELDRYIQESLRTWNAVTFTWKQTFTFTIAAAPNPVWLSLGAMASPRLRSITDTAIYTDMENHLLEPPTGAVWSGTSQFSITDLSLALQRCRDEAIQRSNCNQSNIMPIETTPGDTFINLPDSVLDISRAQWVPNVGGVTTLVRTDTTALNYYQSGFLQTPPATPTQYNVASLPPLSLQVDIPPVDEGAYDLIALLSGPILFPILPTPSLLNVPDDNAWVLKWGALADLLGRESEATDHLRANHCKSRYEDGLKLMSATPWVMQAQINDVAADLVSMTEMDRYRPEWDTMPPDFQTIVTAGIDFFTFVPDLNNPMSVSMTVLANAPVPVADMDFIQTSRDSWDAILDYAQFLAAFKQGGNEFTTSLPLEKNFYKQAMKVNGMLEKLGLFTDEYDAEGTREIRVQERFEVEQ